MAKTLHIGRCLSNSWQLLRQRPWLWLALTGISVVVQSIIAIFLFINVVLLASRVESRDGAESIMDRLKTAASFDLPVGELATHFTEINIPWLIFSLLAALLAALAIKMGWAHISMKAVYGESCSLGNFFRPMTNLRNLGTFFVAHLLFMGMLIVAMAVPMIAYFWLRPPFGYLPPILVGVVLDALLIPTFILWPYLAMRRQLGPVQALCAASKVSKGGRLPLLMLIILFAVIEWALGLIPVLGYLLAVAILTAWSNLAFGEATKSLVTQTGPTSSPAAPPSDR